MLSKEDAKIAVANFNIFLVDEKGMKALLVIHKHNAQLANLLHDSLMAFIEEYEQSPVPFDNCYLQNMAYDLIIETANNYQKRDENNA